MGVTCKIVYKSNGRVNKTGIHSVYISITINRKTKLFSTGVKIPETYWQDKENKWVSERYPGAFHLNKLIRNRYNKILEFIARRQGYNQPVTMDVVSEFWNKRLDVITVNDYMTSYLNSRKFEAYRTKEKYKTFQKHLDAFNAEVTFNSLDESLLKKFADYLKGKDQKPNTIDKYLQCFKTVVAASVKDGYLEKDPFYGAVIKLDKYRPSVVRLTIHEIETLRQMDLTDNPALHRNRNQFLFCFYAGIYYEDLRQLHWKHVCETEDGFVFLDAARAKNDEPYQSPIGLFPHALQILDEQKGKDAELIFPDTIESQPFNRALKRLAELAGIEKKISGKTGRHSLIQFMQGTGCPIQFTSKVAGHTKLSTTQSYYQTTVHEVRNYMAKVDSPLFKVS